MNVINVITEVKEHSIIFGTEMVRAILDGRKTQTRRVIKPQPKPCNHKDSLAGYGEEDRPTEFECENGDFYCKYCGNGIRRDPKSDNPYDWIAIRCPYGQAGDRLWVRETWYPKSTWDGGKVIYKADHDHALPQGYRWKPSIHMPRRLSRITLEITGVRVERLQEISKEDCYAESIYLARVGPETPTWAVIDSLRFKFKSLWNSLNAKRGYGWETNPWVWVISFNLWCPVVKSGV